MPGLPEPLPPGEVLLWQGSPKWTEIAQRVFLIRWVVLYFAALSVWEVINLILAGEAALSILAAVTLLLLIGMLALVIIGLLAKIIAHTSIYSITSKRIVLRVGVALPITINIPFAVIDGASLMQRKNGSGEIMLQLSPSHRISWIALWPHCSGWSFGRPKPTLRGVENVTAVSQILGGAVASASGAVVARHRQGNPPLAPSSVTAMA
ncbi:MAG: photosynthetic complex putative assembly protein PuhB [Roseomonas sp.]